MLVVLKCMLNWGLYRLYGILINWISNKEVRTKRIRILNLKVGE